MAIQEDAIARLNKDKRGVDDQLKGLSENIAAEEDKCNSLNKAKHKLESQIDEVRG